MNLSRIPNMSYSISLQKLVWGMLALCVAFLGVLVVKLYRHRRRMKDLVSRNTISHLDQHY